jgi:hypothetical protein
MCRPQPQGDLGMTTAKHQSPSRLRYNAAHRTIGVHVSLPAYERLVALREASGLSFGQLILGPLGEVEIDVATARRVGYQEGYTKGSIDGHVKGGQAGYVEAMNEFQLSLPCATCGHDMEIFAGSPLAQAAIASVKEQGWVHSKCGDPEPS